MGPPCRVDSVSGHSTAELHFAPDSVRNIFYKNLNNRKITVLISKTEDIILITVICIVQVSHRIW